MRAGEGPGLSIACIMMYSLLLPTEDRILCSSALASPLALHAGPESFCHDGTDVSRRCKH